MFDTDGVAKGDVHFYQSTQLADVYLREYNVASFTRFENDTLYRVDMYPAGDNVDHVEPTPIDQLVVAKNFYTAGLADPVLHVPSYERIVYEGVYDGIDFHYYSNNMGPKMAIVLHPGSDPADLQLGFNGQDSLGIDVDGALKAYIKQKYIRLEEAVAYQANGQQIIPVNWGADYQYIQGSPIVTFYFGSYDPNLPLILQIGQVAPPSAGGGTPEWGTYFGGSKDDEIFDIEVNQINGDLYYAGRTTSTPSNGFPITAGAYQAINYGVRDGFFGHVNYNHIPQSLTYYGGSANDGVLGIALEHGTPTPDVYICGGSESTDWSMIGQSSGPNSFWNDVIGSSPNAFVARFNDSGVRVWGTMIVPGWAAAAAGLVVNSNNELFVIGTADGVNEIAPPIGCDPWPNQMTICDPLNGAYVQPWNATTIGQGWMTDGFIMKFNSNNGIEWSTLFGGEHRDWIHDLAYDEANERLYICGNTLGRQYQWATQCQPSYFGFPICYYPGSFFDGEQNGNMPTPLDTNKADGFVAQFTNGGVLEWSTLIGGQNEENITGIDVSSNGDVYITGYSGSGTTLTCDGNYLEFPICTQPPQYNIIAGLGNKQFIARFNVDRQMTWSSWLDEAPGSFWHRGYAFENGIGNYPGRVVVDSNSDVFVVSSTYAGSGSIASAPIVPNWVFYEQSLHGDSPNSGTDIYVVGFSNNDEILFSTYFGGNGTVGLNGLPVGDTGYGLDAFGASRLFIAGTTHSSSFFPLAPSNFQFAYFQPQHGNPATDQRLDGFLAQIRLSTTGIAVTSTEALNLAVYPNPVQSNLLITWPEGWQFGSIVGIEIFDVRGRLVVSEELRIDDRTLEVDISALTDGAYVVKAINGDERARALIMKE